MSEEGTIAVPGGNVVWYRQESQHLGRAPVVVVHGGPGVGAHYVKPLFRLATDRPVITWDQLDSGRSDRPHDPSLWTLARFAEELNVIRNELAAGPVHLLGHSFGSMVLMEWLSTHPSDDVLSVTLASPCLSMTDWKQDTDEIVRSLSTEAQAAIASAIKNNSFQSEAFEEANWNEYVPRCICRSLSPDAVREMFAGSNDEMMSYMWGPTDFVPTGTMNNYTQLATLSTLPMPILFHCGQWDEATPRRVEGYARMCPNGKFSMADESGHLTMVDNPSDTLASIQEFLEEADTSEYARGIFV